MAMNRKVFATLVASSVVGVAAVMVQRSHACVVKKEEGERVGNETPKTEEVDYMNYKQSFSSVVYGAHVNPHYIQSLFKRAEKKATPDNNNTKGWDAVRGPK